jgi:Uma2 family endonuclease
VRVQAPFGASDVSEPEPDLAIVAPGDYLTEHPSRAFLLIEVADSSLQDDRKIKGPLHASAGVTEYWIVDIAGSAVEVHREPRGDGYASVSRHGRDAKLVVPGFEDVVVAVGEVLPRRAVEASSYWLDEPLKIGQLPAPCAGERQSSWRKRRRTQ